MPKKLIIEYFGFRGEGSTAKEAKLEAGRKIAALHVSRWSADRSCPRLRSCSQFVEVMEEVRAFQQSAEAGPGSTRRSVEPEVPRCNGYPRVPMLEVTDG